jgi:hypothetical protein
VQLLAVLVEVVRVRLELIHQAAIMVAQVVLVRLHQ